MANKNFYAVRGELASDIFTTWDETKKEKANKAKYGKVEFKGFSTRAEAESFIAGKQADGVYQDELLNPDLLYCYSDGSSCPPSENNPTMGLGYGVVIVKNSKIIHEIGGNPNSDYVKQNQIVGELTAAVRIVQYLAKTNYQGDAVIAYDYKGVEDFVTGKQKPSVGAKLTSGYRDYMQKALPQLKLQGCSLSFIKVSAHSKNKFNERADQIAKSFAKKIPIKLVSNN